MKNYFLKNFKIVFENYISNVNLFIENGKISFNPALNPNLYQIIDGENKKYILPGAIDVHTHFSLNLGPDRISSDDFVSGGKAALVGGVTTLFDFAHQDYEKETLLEAYKRRKEESSNCPANIFFHSGIMRLDDDIEEQIYEISDFGVRTFKIYLNSVKTTDLFLYRAFKAIKNINGIAVLHCEAGDIIEYNKALLHNEGKVSVENHPLSRPDYLESFAIAKVIEIAKFFDTNIYIVHLSTEKGLNLIRRNKSNLSFLECETAPHYLLLTQEKYYSEKGYYYTCCPPFRKENDNEALWNGLRDETIKVIATDHCPFTANQKEKFADSFINYVFGLPGLETAYPIILSEGLARGFSINQIVKWYSTNPAKLFNLFPSKGVIQEGCDADLIIYNPDIIWEINHAKLHSDCGFNQFDGLKIKGKIENTFISGKLFDPNTGILNES